MGLGESLLRKAARSILTKDLPDLALFEFRPAVVLSTRAPGPSFLHLVPHIVALRSQKQVGGIAARRVIAAMENTEAGGGGAVC